MRPLALAVILSLGATAASAHESLTRHGGECTASNFRWDGQQAFVEKQIIDGSSLRSLEVAVSNAPVSVTGGNAAGYTIEACKAAARQEDLAAIRVRLDGNELREDGPSGGRWTVTYQIRAPRAADLTLDTRNGPLSIRDVDGRLVARSANGPLSLHNLSGSVDATTTNGPITVKGGAGTMKLQAQNGPLTIHLNDQAWQGTLDASTQNGPLTLKLPRGYGSGIVVETNGRSPVSCHIPGCEQARATLDASDWPHQPRRMSLGSGPETIHLKAGNGPVSIKEE